MEYSAVLFSLLIYAIYVLLPLIPAVIIYRLFPDTKVGTTGLLGNIKINASGAFGAYIITVLLGHFIINQAVEIVVDTSRSGQTWEVKCNLIFTDSNGQNIQIQDDIIKNGLNISFSPDDNLVTKDLVRIIAIEKSKLPIVTFNLSGYVAKPIDLEEKKNEKKNYEEHILELGEIQLIQSTQPYNEVPIDNQVLTSTEDGPPIQPNNPTPE